MKLGLTKTESLVYVALIPMNNSKASDIAKMVGISRAQVYHVLENL
ncbi:MAG: helix-turn-helix domain-containing protein, partial [Candidatus Hodarchaeales archaeon]